MLSALRDVRAGVLAARERLFERCVPDGVSLTGIIKAVTYGYLKASHLQPVAGGAGSSSAPSKAAAALRVWPLLAAVAAEVLPRDSGDVGKAICCSSWPFTRLMRVVTAQPPPRR